ncbi:signal transduction histidine kinase [Elusimicrobium posterum]|uniref:hypothetical protein n=1 Tax=Elusimicrobium posterum TaxID=3116653 RepID=UPI003C7077DF
MLKKINILETLAVTALSLLLAYFFKWQLADFVWAFWISAILLTIAAIAALEGATIFKSKGYRLAAFFISGFRLSIASLVCIPIIAAVLVLSTILTGVFPILPPNNGLGEGGAMLLATAKTAIISYFPFLVIVFWEERGLFSFKNIPSAIEEQERVYEQGENYKGNPEFTKRVLKIFLLISISVIKILITIMFSMALIGVFKVNEFIVFTICYLMYFLVPSHRIIPDK